MKFCNVKQSDWNTALKIILATFLIAFSRLKPAKVQFFAFRVKITTLLAISEQHEN